MSAHLMVVMNIKVVPAQLRWIHITSSGNVTASGSELYAQVFEIKGTKDSDYSKDRHIMLNAIYEMRDHYRWMEPYIEMSMVRFFLNQLYAQLGVEESTRHDVADVLEWQESVKRVNNDSEFGILRGASGVW